MRKFFRNQGKHYFRLDSAEDNDRLSKYYEGNGYFPVGTCSDDPYIGILRQKSLD